MKFLRWGSGLQQIAKKVDWGFTKSEKTETSIGAKSQNFISWHFYPVS